MIENYVILKTKDGQLIQVPSEFVAGFKEKFKDKLEDEPVYNTDK